MFSQVKALKMEMVVLLAAANRCPPMLKQHSAHALMAISFTSLRPQEASCHGHGRLTKIWMPQRSAFELPHMSLPLQLGNYSCL